MDQYAVPQIMTAFISSDGKEWQDEYGAVTPVAGQFIYRGNGEGGYQAYKIAEVWLVEEKHGPVTHGLTAFVDPVDVMETRLGQQSPTYYKTGGF